MTTKENDNDSTTSNIINNKSLSISKEQRKLIYEKVINSICKIIIDNTQKGFGFFCHIPNRQKVNQNENLIYTLITNESTLSLEYIKSKPFINLLLNEDKLNKQIALNDSRVYYTNESMNLTFIEINPDLDGIDKNYFFGLDDNIYKNDLNSIYKNKKIYIIERPHFQSDYIYISSIDEIDDKFLVFKAQTGFKCFCTPIFNLDNNKIIGINFDDNNSYDHIINKSLCFKSIINEFYNRNEIIISTKLTYQSKKRKNFVYLMSEEFNNANNKNSPIQKIDESNIEIYINNQKVEYSKYFKPEYDKLYIIKIKFNTNILVNCYKMFYQCKFITKIDLSSFHSEEVTNVSYMFSDCQNLSNINISHLNAEKVLDMSYMFYNCNNLNNINFSSFKTNLLTNMQSMFLLCLKLKEINLSNLNTKNVTNMDNLFKECHSLKILDLSSLDFTKVISLKGIFDSCLNLTSIKLNTKLNTPNLINMEKMFYDCQNLENINEIFNLFNISKVTNMSHTFYGCFSLKKLNLCFDNLDTSNVVDMSKMFFKCKNLFQIDLNEKFNTKNVRNMNQMFAYCTNLIKVDLSTFNIENVENMAEMFYFCSNLQQINLSKSSIKNVNTMNKMLYNCFSLQKLELNFSKSEKIIDFNNIFTNCYSLHFVNLYSLDSKKIKNINNISIFKNCFNLLGIYLNKETHLELKPHLNNLAVRIKEKGI